MSETPYEAFEPIIGLEIHTQLNTRTKLFSATGYQFGNEPNSNIGVVDTGQAGALPVLNGEAVKKAVLFGLAVGAKISLCSRFDRKSYFYPDCPRNYQITQFDEPIIIGGEVVADVEGKSKTFAIEKAHLEDDAGMLKHFSDFAGVDFNRAGVPLIEIVSTPCMRSPKEATAYATAIRSILQYTNVSDGNMEEGSLRIDVNVSVRPKGSTTLRNKVEIKNMNSFSNMELAIEAEIRRQIREYLAHPNMPHKEVVPQATCRFDLAKNETVVMRTKESAADYRYFPEPDLPPLVLTEEYVENLRTKLPELPHQRYERYVQKLELSEYFASLLVNDKRLSDFFERGLQTCKNAKGLCNWVCVEFVGRFKESGTHLAQSEVLPERIAELVNLIEEKVVTGRMAKEIADLMVKDPAKTPRQIIDENPHFKPMDDTGEIEALVDQVLKENPDSIEKFRSGRERAFNFLVGQVMKLSKGKAAPHLVQEILKKKLA
ncbi:MAG: Asp-tRNA(Asn)/Glu-tRNA(Gln) amidotransferase subunit GatB [Candidatus Algichlamydia australiensis]|nr:Asp-tRNA(Asn)/Glu-tRNA(Gln) amidotransferase subunit GatB [Chlamydiales bacterium]